jgi:hypothetical protein
MEVLESITLMEESMQTLTQENDELRRTLDIVMAKYRHQSDMMQSEKKKWRHDMESVLEQERVRMRLMSGIKIIFF